MEGHEVQEAAEQLTVVLWKWGTKYTSNHVNILARSLALHLHLPHNVVCLTDDTEGLDPDIVTMPLPCEQGKIHARRLWIFSDEARMLGRRILQIDLDMVIVDDITDLINRHEPLVVWACEAIGRIGFALNPSLLLLDTGSHTHIWESYLAHGDQLVRDANRAGCPASDQAVITYLLTVPSTVRVKGRTCLSRRPTIPVWTLSDGLVGFRTRMRHAPAELPENTRIVSFHGPHDQANYTHLPWVKRHWSDVLDSTEPVSQEVSHGSS